MNGLGMLGAATLALLAVAVCADAQMEAGTWELNGSLAWATASYSYDGEDAGSESALTLAPGVGNFVADRVEIRFEMPLQYIGLSNGSDYSRTTVTPRAALLYHFGTSGTVVPYVGAGAGVSFASDSEGDDYETALILPSIHAGIRSFLSDRACVTTELLYQHQSNAAYIEDLSANVFGLTAGLSVFF
jgi:hypothetical protein